MESSSSDHQYEDDFEVSNELPSPKFQKTSPKPPSKPPRKENSAIPENPYNPNQIFKSEIHPPKKSLKTLEKENQQLKSELKSLNDRISVLLDKKPPKPSMPKPKSEKKPNENQVQQKLTNYELEYLRVKQIYQKFNDTDCLFNLRQEVKSKQSSIDELEKELKKLKFSIESKQKNINNHDKVEVPEDKILHKQLMTENISALEEIASVEKNIEKILEKQEKNSKIEEDLKEKFEKLTSAASEYIVEAEGSKSKELYEASKKTLENLQKITQSAVTQLRIKEHDLKLENKKLDNELSKYKEWLKEKDSILAQVKVELDEVMQMSSASKLDQLASLLKSANRTAGGMRSLSPRGGSWTSVGVKSEGGSKNVLRSPLRGVLSRKESEERVVKKSVERLEIESGESDCKGGKSEEVKGSKVNDGKGVKESGEKAEGAKGMAEVGVGEGEIEDKARKVVFEEEKKVEKGKKIVAIEKKDIKTGQSLKKKTEPHLLNSEISEEISNPEESPNPLKKPSIFEELESLPKKSIFEELESPPKKSIFEELESPPKKSIFEELESPPKKSIFEELESIPNPPKKSFFEDLEPPQNPPIKSVFDDLESSPNLPKKSTFEDLEEVALKTLQFVETQPAKLFMTEFNTAVPTASKEMETENVSFPKSNSPNGVFSNPEKVVSADLFAAIPLSNPKEKRNREHLFN